MSRALSLLTALAALGLGLQGRAAHAGAYTYDTSARRTVNAGILLLDSTTDITTPTKIAQGPDNKDPYLFHVLNQRIDIRPYGWNIINPLAPRTVTQAIQARWNARANAPANNPVYGVGQTITPNMAPYWEVDLQRTSAQDISQFDVLFLGIDTGRRARFSVSDQQKLLHFIDNGGKLWIEYVGNAVSSTVAPLDTEANLFFKFPLQFKGTSSGTNFAVAGAGTGQPILTTPYRLSGAEINALGDKQVGDYCAYDGTSGPPGPGLLATVVGNSGRGGLPVIAAGDLGAGGLVVSTMGIANAINETIQVAGNAEGPSGYNSGPYTGTNYLNAPTPELKFLSNLLASVGAHANEHQNSHQTGSTPNGIPSASRTWTTNGVLTGGTKSAVINGNMAYVTTGGILRAFDLNPSEDLDGDNQPEDGLASGYAGGARNADYSRGAPYDQVWQVDVGDSASAPTVVVFPNTSTPVVLVEKADGEVVAFDGAKGGAPPAGVPASFSDSGGRGGYGAPGAPSPTYYNGRVYAGGADGSLYVFDFGAPTATQTAVFKVDPNGGSPAPPVVAPPTVGTVMDGGVNDILALVTTSNGLFSVFLGARGETLQKMGGGGDYNTKLQPLSSARMDASLTRAKAYFIQNPSDGYPFPATGATPSATTPNFTGYMGRPALLADYDVDFSASATASANAPLTRTTVSLTSGPTTPGASALTPPVPSAPALDHFGNVYYTAGNALFCVHDTAGLPQIKWRFRLPAYSQSITDADGTNYGPLQGFQFVGAPVIGDQGQVYVLAAPGAAAPAGGGGAAVLCFDGQGGVSADAPGVGTNIDIAQPLSPGGVNEFGNTFPNYIGPEQFSINTEGHIEFSNFSHNDGSGGRKSLAPNLNEPFPIVVQIKPPQNQPPQAPFAVGLHTNLVWYSVTGTYGPSGRSGLAKVGASLFYTAANGHLIRVDSDPATARSPVNKAIVDVTAPTAAPNPMFHDIGDTGVGAGATPSSTNGVLVVNGPNGVSNYVNQVTLVVDNNRLLEMDADGNAMWAVDSTLKTTVAGGVAPVYNGGTPPANPGQYVTTALELNRPSSVSELTANDYLVADTGNNRCVRFDRGAKVIWELTKFNSFDPTLLRPGEPDTLNQPTSVQIRSFKSGANTVVQYLIADSGNFRVLEVSDVFDANFQIAKDTSGNLLYHVLTWVSHTHDMQARDYRYQSAGYYAATYTDTSNNVITRYFVAALVTNKRIAPLPATNATTGALAPANQDTSGGSIVLLNYVDPTTSSLPIGYIASATTAFQAGGRTVQLRNPRFLRSYAPNPPSSTNFGNFLLADDNGVFDLALTGLQFSVTWSFTQADYQGMTTPLDEMGAKTLAAAQMAAKMGAPLPPPGKDGKFYRKYDSTIPGSQNIPFVPTSLQKLGPGRYLVTNSFGQGEAGTSFGDYGAATPVPPGFGGEVFEVDTTGPSPVFGGYGGHTLSRPTNTGTLTQPTFAHRVQ